MSGNPDEPASKRTRRISKQLHSESRATTKQLPPLAKPAARLTIELEDASQLVEFLEHVTAVLRAGKKITVLVEE